MSDELLAGVLVREDRFRLGHGLPAYLMVVDKRTVKPADEQRQWWMDWSKEAFLRTPDEIDEARPKAQKLYDDEPRERSPHLNFGPGVREVEVLLPSGERHVQPIRAEGDGTVHLPPLKPGAGVLLKIN